MQDGPAPQRVRDLQRPQHADQLSSCHSRDYRGQIDAFAVFCPDTAGVYFVPIDDSMATDVALRVAPPDNRQQKGVRWARDYELL